MLFGPDNFLAHLKNLVMGGGRSAAGLPALDSGFLKDSDDLIGASVLAASVTRITDADGFPTLNAAAGITAVANIQLRVPRDYDENTDILVVRFSAKMGGATDVPTLTMAAKKRAVGGAAAAITPVSGSPTAALSATAQQFELTFRGQALLRGQAVEFLITSGAHATDALQLQSFSYSYHSTLVSYNEFDSSNNPLR